MVQMKGKEVFGFLQLVALVLAILRGMIFSQFVSKLIMSLKYSLKYL